MKEITVKVDSVTVRLQAPAGVELPLRGDLTEAGIRDRLAAMAEVVRTVPVSVEPVPVVAVRAGLAIADTARLITDPGFGKYPHKCPFRDELLRALAFAGEVWGDRTWESIDDADWTKLLRRRCEALIAKGCRAVRATEITISRLITAVSWLRDTKRIARDAACWPREWKKDVAKHWRGVTGSDRDQQPKQLRYTIEEFQRILAKSDFDPRLFLLLRLAVGLRPGQVARARRSDLWLPPVDWQAEPPRDKHGTDLTDYGTLEVHGAGKKGGATVDLTRGQRLVVEQALVGDGYLAAVDARYLQRELDDYVLFPSGYVVGRVGMMRGQDTKLSLSEHVDFTKHCSGSWVRKSWRTAEARAGIPHIQGLCTYGQRRLTVDAGVEDGLSPSGIQGLGGWGRGSNIPMAVYREGENKTGRREARPTRARMLGEVL